MSKKSQALSQFISKQYLRDIFNHFRRRRIVAVDAFPSISMLLPAYASLTCAARSWFMKPFVPVEPSTDRFQTGLPFSRAGAAPGPG